MIRILIADDHPVVRSGIRRIVEEESDMRVVGEAADGSAVLSEVERQAADVLLLDIAMPGPGFLEVLDRCSGRHPDLQVLVLSIYPEDQYAVRALQAGAAGYLTKDQSPEKLVGAIRQVATGRSFISAELAEELAFRLRSGNRPRHEALSAREHQVLRLLGQGHTVKEIAERLYLSPKTVSTYRSRILQKLELQTNADVVQYVRIHGLDV